MFELVEPIATVTFSTGPDEAFRTLGMRNYWDGYFAGRAAPPGRAVKSSCVVSVSLRVK